MGSGYSRREFLGGMLAAGAAAALPGGALAAPRLDSPFEVAVINDEISPDFGRVVEVVSGEFGMRYIELRGMWGKNIMNLDEQQLAEAQRLLAQASLRVTDIASPIFKVD